MRNKIFGGIFMENKLNKIKEFTREHHDDIPIFVGMLTAATVGYYIGCKETKHKIFIAIEKLVTDETVMENVKITGES